MNHEQKNLLTAAGILVGFLLLTVAIAASAAAIGRHDAGPPAGEVVVDLDDCIAHGEGWLCPIGEDRQQEVAP